MSATMHFLLRIKFNKKLLIINFTIHYCIIQTMLSYCMGEVKFRYNIYLTTSNRNAGSTAEILVYTYD